jgi:exodeoxyribonuclease VII small subunit
MSNRLSKRNTESDVCFEEALGKLELIVKEFEKGDLPLEVSLEKFAEGVKLSQLCLAKLNTAEQKIDKILREEKGTIKEYPLELQEEGRC